MLSSTQKDFNSFLKENALWFALGLAAVILIVVLVFVLVALKKRKKTAPAAKVDSSVYIDALGGAENIISHSCVRSRIVIELNDGSIVDKEKLKETGVDSFIVMSNKLTLVVKEGAEDVYRLIFPGN